MVRLRKKREEGKEKRRGPTRVDRCVKTHKEKKILPNREYVLNSANLSRGLGREEERRGARTFLEDIDLDLSITYPPLCSAFGEKGEKHLA